MLSNMVTAFIVPPSNSSNTDILLSNITGESELESDNSISKQRGKDLKCLFKTIYTDFYKAGNSSWCKYDIVDDYDNFDHYIIIIMMII